MATEREDSFLDRISCPAGSKYVALCGAVAFARALQSNGDYKFENFNNAIFSRINGKLNGPFIQYKIFEDNISIEIVDYINGVKTGPIRVYYFDRNFGQLYSITPNIANSLLQLQPGDYDYGNNNSFVKSEVNPAIQYRIEGYYYKDKLVPRDEYLAARKKEIDSASQQAKELIEIISGYL